MVMLLKKVTVPSVTVMRSSFGRRESLSEAVAGPEVVPPRPDIERPISRSRHSRTRDFRTVDHPFGDLQDEPDHRLASVTSGFKFFAIGGATLQCRSS